MVAVISRSQPVLARPWRPQELVPGIASAQEELPPAPPPEPVILPTIAEVEQIRAQAHEEGFASGRQEAIGQLTGEVRALMQGMAAVTAQLAAFDAIYERFFSNVGQAIAKAMDHLPAEEMAEKVGRALATIARPEKLVLTLHPDDMVGLREVAPDMLANPEMTVNRSDSVGRGGFTIRSPSGDVDATLQSAIQQLKKALQDAPE